MAGPGESWPAKNIIPLLKVFFGDIPKFAATRKAMHDAWRLAGGLKAVEASPPPSPPRTIESTPFSDVAEIVDLEVSQPTPDNSGNLIVPVTLRIHPEAKLALFVCADPEIRNKSHEQFSCIDGWGA